MTIVNQTPVTITVQNSYKIKPNATGYMFNKSFSSISINSNIGGALIDIANFKVSNCRSWGKFKVKHEMQLNDVSVTIYI